MCIRDRPPPPAAQVLADEAPGIRLPKDILSLVIVAPLVWRSPEVAKSKYQPDRTVVSASASVSVDARPGANSCTVITPVDALDVPALKLSLIHIFWELQGNTARAS